VIGAMIFEESTPLPDHVLAVSGFTSYEIIQKALV
jgi:formate dehydrogenase assembly factor FdhD